MFYVVHYEIREDGYGKILNTQGPVSEYQIVDSANKIIFETSIIPDGKMVDIENQTLIPYQHPPGYVEPPEEEP